MSVSEFAIFSNPTIRNLYGKPKTNTAKFSILKKLAEKASFLICPPLRSRLWGVTERGFKGEDDEDPCGRVLGPPPFYGVVMSMTLTYTR